MLSILPEEVHAGQVLKAGGAGFINKKTANADLTGAMRKVVGGGKYVSAAFAEKLATDFAEGGEKPPHNLLSDREYRVMWLIAGQAYQTAIIGGHLADKQSSKPELNGRTGHI